MRGLLKVKDALSQMVICPQWGAWKASNTERALKIRGMILDERWWVRVQYVLDMTEPIMTMLCFADTDTPCLGDVYDGMDTMVEKVASSSATERNWSTYSYIHSVKHNRLGSKKVEGLVFIHTNLCLLSRKDEEYMDGAAKLWDVLPKCANLDATLRDLTTMMDNGDDKSMTHGVSIASRTILGSNAMDLEAVGDEGPYFFENPYDSD